MLTIRTIRSIRRVYLKMGAVHLSDIVLHPPAEINSLIQYCKIIVIDKFP